MYKFRMAPAGARNRPPLINPGCGNLPECIRATLPTHRITRLSRTQLTTGHLSGCPRRWKLKHGAISRLARKRGSVGAAPAPVALLLPVMCDGETNTHTESQQRDAPDQVVEFESSGGDACLGAIRVFYAESALPLVFAFRSGIDSDATLAAVEMVVVPPLPAMAYSAVIGSPSMSSAMATAWVRVVPRGISTVAWVVPVRRTHLTEPAGPAVSSSATRLASAHPMPALAIRPQKSPLRASANEVLAASCIAL